jgi:hypothetical protein
MKVVFWLLDRLVPTLLMGASAALLTAGMLSYAPSAFGEWETPAPLIGGGNPLLDSAAPGVATPGTSGAATGSGDLPATPLVTLAPGETPAPVPTDLPTDIPTGIPAEQPSDQPLITQPPGSEPTPAPTAGNPGWPTPAPTVGNGGWPTPHPTLAPGQTPGPTNPVVPTPVVPTPVPVPTPTLAPGQTPRPTPVPTPRPTPAPPSNAVATRVVVPSLDIDLATVASNLVVPGDTDFYPLCDVAMYMVGFVNPGMPGTTYIYGHAQDGMFAPLLHASKYNDGASMIGALVQVYTADNMLHLYEIYKVKRHATDLTITNIPSGTHQLVLQTSEGWHGHIPKLQVAARPLTVLPASYADAHPPTHPRVCLPN